MDWTEIFKTLLTATIPAVLTYIATKKNNESKIKEITISKDSEIQQLKLQHQHEIDKLESEHKHSIEKLKFEHQLKKDNKSDDISTDLALKFLNGNLDLSNILANINQLDTLQQKIDKLNSDKFNSY